MKQLTFNAHTWALLETTSFPELFSSLIDRKGRVTLLFSARTLSRPYSQGRTVARKVTHLRTVFMYHLYILIFHCITIFFVWAYFKQSESITKLCLTRCDPMGYTVHGILQARILEWVAFPFSRGSSQPRDQTQVSCIAGGFLTN